jgi:mRNA interferase MazF
MKNKIILVPFPFDDLSELKVRPALCLTHAITTHQHVIIAFITSQTQNANEATDIIIRQTDVDFLQTGLITNSAIRLHRVVTIPISLIRRQLGILPASYQSSVNEKLRQLFDL